MMMKNVQHFVFLLCILMGNTVMGQIGINNPNPDASAILDIKSNQEGFLLPRMTSTERLAIPNPANALLVFDLDDQFFYYYDVNSPSGVFWTGISPWLYRDDQSDFEILTGNYLRDVCTHPSVKSVNIGTNNPLPANQVTIVGRVAIGDSVTLAPENGLYVFGEVNSQTSVTVSNTITADAFVGYGSIPVGGIIMWSGTLASLPSEWAICDGSTVNGLSTPDLRGKFIVSYNSSGAITPTNATGQEVNTGAVNNTGGENTHVLTVNEMPSHDHNGATQSGGSHTHGFTDRERDGTGVGYFDNKNQGRGSGTSAADTTAMQGIDHQHLINEDGASLAHENRPAYYVLAFIIRTE